MILEAKGVLKDISGSEPRMIYVLAAKAFVVKVKTVKGVESIIVGFIKNKEDDMLFAILATKQHKFYYASSSEYNYDTESKFTKEECIGLYEQFGTLLEVWKQTETIQEISLG